MIERSQYDAVIRKIQNARTRCKPEDKATLKQMAGHIKKVRKERGIQDGPSMRDSRFSEDAGSVNPFICAEGAFGGKELQI